MKNQNPNASVPATSRPIRRPSSVDWHLRRPEVRIQDPKKINKSEQILGTVRKDQEAGDE